MDKETYYLYEKIRFIVGSASCKRISAKDVKHKINDQHYRLINDYYGLSIVEIDEVIDKMIANTPPSKILK